MVKYNLHQAQKIVLSKMTETWTDLFCPEELVKQFHIGELSYFPIFEGLFEEGLVEKKSFGLDPKTTLMQIV